MEKKYIILTALLIIVGVIIPVSASFETISRSYEWEDSNYDLCFNNLTGSSYSSSHWNIAYYFQKIELYDESTFTIVEINPWVGNSKRCTVDDPEITYGSLEVALNSAYPDYTPLGNGTLYYNINLDADGDPIQIITWIDVTDFDTGTYTGGHSVQVDYDRNDINGLRIYSAALSTMYDVTDYSVYMVHPVFPTYKTMGTHIIRSALNWELDYTITPDDSENPGKFNFTATRNGYFSDIYGYGDDILYIHDESGFDFWSNIWDYPIEIDVKDTKDNWYNETFYSESGGNDNYFLLDTNPESGTVYVGDPIYTILYELDPPPYNRIDWQYQKDGSTYYTAKYKEIGGTWYEMNPATGQYDIVSSWNDAATQGNEGYSPMTITLKCTVRNDDQFIWSDSIDNTWTGDIGKTDLTVYYLDGSKGNSILTGVNVLIEDITNSTTIYNGTLSSGYYEAEVVTGHFIGAAGWKSGYNYGYQFTQIPDDQEEWNLNVVMYPTDMPTNTSNVYLEFQTWNEANQYLGGCWVTLDSSYSKTTNSMGYVKFEVPKNSTHTWEVSKEGYFSATGSTSVTTTNERVDVALVEESGPFPTPSAGPTPTSGPTSTPGGGGGDIAPSLESGMAIWLENAELIGALLFIAFLINVLKMI